MHTLYATNYAEYNRKLKQSLTNNDTTNAATHPTSSVYSTKKLACEGRACTKCGNCRDWYWRTDHDCKVYTKRIDASCTTPEHAYRSRYYSLLTGGGHYKYWHYHVIDEHKFDVIYMCECEDNQE